MNGEKAVTPIFISSKEIARILGISKSGVFNLLKRGEFPVGIKVGRNRRWRLSEVEDWIASQEAAMKTKNLQSNPQKSASL